MEASEAYDFHHREIILDHLDVLNSDQIGRSDLPLTVDGSGSRDLHRMVAIVRDLGDARGAIAIFINWTAGGGLAS